MGYSPCGHRVRHKLPTEHAHTHTHTHTHTEAVKQFLGHGLVCFSVPPYNPTKKLGWSV